MHSDPFSDIDCRDHPTATPAWYIVNDKLRTTMFTGPFRNSRDLGDYLKDVEPLVIEERVEWVGPRPTCQAGHPLIVTSKGTFWNTVDTAGKVVRSVVLADAGDAGNLDPHPHQLFGCNENGCNAEVSDEAAELAIKAVDESEWDLVFTDRMTGFIRMEG